MPETDAQSVWNPGWSWRGWVWVVGFGLAAAAAVLLWSHAPWWTAAVLAVFLPAAFWATAVQRNLEWEGYHRCPTCHGTGKVKDDNS